MKLCGKGLLCSSTLSASVDVCNSWKNNVLVGKQSNMDKRKVTPPWFCGHFIYKSICLLAFEIQVNFNCKC